MIGTDDGPNCNTFMASTWGLGFSCHSGLFTSMSSVFNCD